jgi:nucleoside-diphosphate-sugar epimerase
MTTGEEKRRFLYKTDCVSALMSLFDGQLNTAEIAGSEWVTIRTVAEEIADQLGVEAEFGQMRGSEVPINPSELLQGWLPTVSLRDGLAQVISEATSYLQQAQTSTAVKLDASSSDAFVASVAIDE